MRPSIVRSFIQTISLRNSVPLELLGEQLLQSVHRLVVAVNLFFATQQRFQEPVVSGGARQFVLCFLFSDDVRRASGPAVTTDAHIERVLLVAISFPGGDSARRVVVVRVLRPHPTVVLPAPYFLVAQQLHRAANLMGEAVTEFVITANRGP